MKALVTGGTGFIGGHVVDLLMQEGWSVRLFSRRDELPERWRGKNVSVLRGDLGDPDSVLDAMEGMDVFFHIGEIKNTSRAASEKNVRLMERIAGHLKDSGIRRLVFISSITVAGIPSDIPAAEATGPEIALKDHYTEYKRRCEEIITRDPGGVDFVILRPAVVYGPGSRYLGRMIEMVKRIGPLGLPFIGDAKNLVPLIHVKDLARAVFLAGGKPAAANQTFNLSDGQRHSWFDFFAAITGAFRRNLRIVPFPPFLARFPAVFADLLAGVFGIAPDLSSYVTFVSRDILFDNGKAVSLLGWNPEYTDVASGVREMVEWYSQPVSH